MNDTIDIDSMTNDQLEEPIWTELEQVITENFDWRLHIEEWREIIPQLIEIQSKEWFPDDVEKRVLLKSRLTFLFRDEIPPQPIDPIVKEFFEFDESSEKGKSDE